MRKLYQDIKDQFDGLGQQMSEHQKDSLYLAEVLLREADKLAEEKEKQELLEKARFLVSFTPAGDQIDLFEVVYGKDINGVKLSDHQRFLSMLGLVIGSRIAWEKILVPTLSKMKTVFKTVSDKILNGKNAKKLLDLANRIKNSAAKLGIKGQNGIKQFAEDLKEIVGNESGQFGFHISKFVELVSSSRKLVDEAGEGVL